MKITVSIIKADIGSIGGHIKPSQKLKDTVADHYYKYGAKKDKRILLIKLNSLTLTGVSFMIDTLCILLALVILLLLKREREMLDIIKDLLKKRSRR